MKKSKFLAMTLAMCLCFATAMLVGCGGKDSSSSESVSTSASESTSDSSVQDIVSLTLSETEVSMRSGEYKTIVAAVTGTEEAVVWTSSDISIASVYEGTITANKEGTVTITATVAGLLKTVTVTIEDEVIFRVEQSTLSLSLAGPIRSMTVGASLEVNGSKKGLTASYESEDSSICTVNSSGMITAVAAGTTRVRAFLVYAGETYEAFITVTVA